MRPVVLQRATIIDWSPLLIARMLLAGVEIEDGCHTYSLVDGQAIVTRERVGRRRVLRRILGLARSWWDWTTALPGDEFIMWAAMRVVRVEGGIGRGRRVRILDERLVALAESTGENREAVWALTPVARSDFRWCEVVRRG